MKYLLLPFAQRYIALTLAFLFAACLGILAWQFPDHRLLIEALLAIALLLVLVGIGDMLQTKRAILRNYPIIGHLRFFFESIRPELRQYFFESEKDGMPFPRDKRAIVYQRAKKVRDKRPFGTHYNVYEDAYEWLHHSMVPKPVANEPFRISIGREEVCQKPYSASVYNISGMSFGALSANAIRALNKGAKMGNFAHTTGEGSVSRYHKEHGGDLIWQIGSGYFGCRDRNGNFSPEKFESAARHPQVKMIEIKLSQGAKPGHGGVLPASKVTREIARARGVPIGQDCISPAFHSAFSTPIELLEFIADLRRLSGGKPVGFKLCVGHPWEFMAVCKAMLETGEAPDFVVVDGNEGGTGAAPLEFMDHLGMPLRDGLSFVHNALVGAGLRDKLKIGASGKVISGFDMARVMALGADWCNAARGFMFAVGCIQAQTCHTGQCPTGVATQDPVRSRGIVVSDKSVRVKNFHDQTVKALAELVAAAGLDHPNQLRPHHFQRRAAADRVVTYAEQYPSLKQGELLSGTRYTLFGDAWSTARADTFAPVTEPVIAELAVAAE